jgi:glycerophosphoryl diester phosphodiesterase
MCALIWPLVQVPTLEEYIDVALTAPRVVGIYPETKHPAWHNSLDILSGTTMEDLLLDVLDAKGYRGATWDSQPVYIQSFEVRVEPPWHRRHSHHSHYRLGHGFCAQDSACMKTMQQIWHPITLHTSYMRSLSRTLQAGTPQTAGCADSQPEMPSAT